MHARWVSLNPVLAVGEIAHDTTNNKIKIGDGVKHWLDLPYWAGGKIGDFKELSTAGFDLRLYGGAKSIGVNPAGFPPNVNFYWVGKTDNTNFAGGSILRIGITADSLRDAIFNNQITANTGGRWYGS